MKLTPNEIDALRARKYLEEVERNAYHALSSDFDAGMEDIIELLDFFKEKWERCGCSTCVLQYQVVWLGHERLLRTGHAQQEQLDELNKMYDPDDLDGPIVV